MKSLMFLISLSIGFSSCSPLFFTEAQPKGQDVLLEYPDELQGVYVDEDLDTMLITKNAFYWGDPNSVGFMSDTLEPNAHLRKMDDFYYLNVQEEGRWLVIPATLEFKKTLVVFFSDFSTENQESFLSKYGTVEKFYNEDGKIDYYLIKAMNKDVVPKMIRNGGVFTERRLRKIE